MTALAQALRRARRCRLCAHELPLGPRPILMLASELRVLIVGQAPGTRAHKRGRPFDDPSGERLRAWLGIDRAAFYGDPRLGCLPMGLCFPGTDARGGDRPPPKICAPTWHPALVPLLPELELTLLVGAHAQAYYLRGRAHRSLTDTVRAWRDYGPRFMPLPHPSWRNTAWLARNPWFARELLPELKARVRAALAGDPARR